MWYQGAGWSQQRPPADSVYGAHIKGQCSSSGGNRATNYIIRNNLMVGVTHRFVRISSSLLNPDGSDSMPSFSGNIFAAEYGQIFGQVEQLETIETLSATNTVEAETWTETFDNCVVGQKPVTLYQGYQTTAKDADGNVNIRFVATVSATEAQLSSYTSVGFEILPVQIKGYTNTFDYTNDPKSGSGIAYPTRIKHGQEPNIVELTDRNKDKATNTLFTSILEGNNERDVAYFLGDNTDGYIYVVNLTGVPTENNLHFAVRTYYTDAAGNKVYGETAYIKVDMSKVG